MKREQRRVGGQPIGGKSVLIGFIIAVAGIATMFVMSGKLNATSPESIAHGQQVAYHIHTTLKIRDQYGDPMTVPAGIGINATLWKDHSLDQYGVPGFAPVHTHDDSGLLHIESLVNRHYTLGDFFRIWGFDINRVHKVTVNYQDYDASSNIGGIVLNDGDIISLYLSR